MYTCVEGCSQVTFDSLLLKTVGSRIRLSTMTPADPLGNPGFLKPAYPTLLLKAY